MPARHLLSTLDLDPQELARLVDRSVDFATGRAGDVRPLAGRIVGIYFRGTSTRTRTAFSAGTLKLGGQVIAYGPNDLQLTTGETLEDTARVLGGYLDTLVIRTNAPVAEMQRLAVAGGIPVVNAMSVEEHPTQAIADLSTLKEAFGRLEGLHVLYVGDGNNTASALAYACSQTPGMRLTVVTPEGYGLDDATLERAWGRAEDHGSTIEQHHRLDQLPRGVDAVYTTRWQTMGTGKSGDGWQRAFEPYRVTAALFERAARPEGTVFLHDLPAMRGQDVDDEVLDGPRSLAWRQARHKMWSAMAVLEWCLEDAS